MARPVHSVHQQNVLPSIAVVVEEGAARAEGFGQQFAAVGAAVVMKVESGRSRIVGQGETEVGSGRQGPRLARSEEGRRRQSRRAPQERSPVQGMFTSPLRIAYTTSSAALWMPRVSMIFARWTATVFTLSFSWSAISLFDFPSTINCRISNSRGVRPSFRSPLSDARRATWGSRTV